MRCVTKDLAAQMEGCIKQTHIEVTKQYEQGKILELSGGAACFSGFNSYLSQVVGWGFATERKSFPNEIECIEHFYRAQQHSRVDIELCPFVGNEIAILLSHRGYTISELNNVSALNLSTYKPIDCSLEPLIIREIQLDEFEHWSKRIALGFGYPEAQQQFLHYIRASGVKAFAAFDGTMIVAGAAIAMYGSFCDLGVTSTY